MRYIKVQARCNSLNQYEHRFMIFWVADGPLLLYFCQGEVRLSQSCQFGPGFAEATDMPPLVVGIPRLDTFPHLLYVAGQLSDPYTVTQVNSASNRRYVSTLCVIIWMTST